MPMAQAAMNYAGVGVRFVATLIDGILLSVVGAIVSIPFIASISAAASNAAASQDPNAVTGAVFGAEVPLILIVVVLGAAYYIVMEATRGATLGKMAMGLRVVRLDGSPISWSEAIIRYLLRIIDGLFYYLVGAIIIWTNPRKQRLGDIVAKTVVIKTR
jgi:uncharacterized RDD family membrane protein YckC